MLADHITTATELGERYRANRRVLRLTQQEVADMVGCRRQTIADLEAGKNVETYTLIAALCALGKVLEIVDVRFDADQLAELFRDE